MKFTFSWLKDFLETSLSVTEIINGLNKIGHEVETVINQADIYHAFIVAEIISTSTHPEADKLKICMVNDGKQILQIICGAPNARAGLKVVLAPIGSEIPSNGLKIKESKIRNVNSCGMLCSGAELNLSTDANGIIELEDHHIVGSSFAQSFGVNEIIIDISITPNRGDCLGVYGIARDLAAAGYGSLKALKAQKQPGSFTSPVIVEVLEPSKCPRYIGRYFKITNTQSPAWLQNRLKSIGEKPISALVDITNYFTFAFGRPLHVFDADLIDQDKIIIRNANKGEELLALNDKNYHLNDDDLIIADANKPIAIAGIIGSKNSAVSENSKNIFLEIGLFDASKITLTARKLQLDTDAKFRFERKIDAEFMHVALDLATSMILEICPGQISYPVIIDNYPQYLKKIDFYLTDLQKYIGLEYPRTKVIEILTSLGFTIIDQDEYLELTVPSWRHDINIKEDIIEEIARIDGYDNIISIKLPPLETTKSPLNQQQRHLYQLPRIAASLGLTETVTWSFINDIKAAKFSILKPELYLKNPISSELNYMRPSILPNLLEAAQKNHNRSINSIALFEIGSVFKGIKPEEQLLTISGLRAGFNDDRNIYHDRRLVDPFDAKADILAILAELGLEANKPQQSSNNLPTYYHPGRAATLSLGKNILGFFGQLHPKIIREYDLEHSVAFELFLDNIPIAKAKHGRKGLLQASDYQEVIRDFAFLIKQDIAVDIIVRSVTMIDKKLIKSVNIFDIYTGAGIAPDEKSVAFSVTMQASDHTLAEQEIDELCQKIILAVSQATGGTQR